MKLADRWSLWSCPLGGLGQALVSCCWLHLGSSFFCISWMSGNYQLSVVLHWGSFACTYVIQDSPEFCIDRLLLKRSDWCSVGNSKSLIKHSLGKLAGQGQFLGEPLALQSNMKERSAQPVSLVFWIVRPGCDINGTQFLELQYLPAVKAPDHTSHGMAGPSARKPDLGLWPVEAAPELHRRAVSSH